MKILLVILVLLTALPGVGPVKCFAQQSPAKAGFHRAGQEMDPAVVNEFEQQKGKLLCPVSNGHIIEPNPNHIYSYKNIYKGVDIKMAKDTNVTAVFKGTVSEIATVPGKGKIVFIKHGEYTIVYAHLTSVAVKKGQEVNTADVVGAFNKTDYWHMYFELRQQKTALNPSEWLACGTIHSPK